MKVIRALDRSRKPWTFHLLRFEKGGYGPAYCGVDAEQTFTNMNVVDAETLAHRGPDSTDCAPCWRKAGAL